MLPMLRKKDGQKNLKQQFWRELDIDTQLARLTGAIDVANDQARHHEHHRVRKLEPPRQERHDTGDHQNGNKGNRHRYDEMCSVIS